MRKYTIILFIFLAVMTGCNALGIKETDNNTKNNVEETSGGFLDDNQVSSGSHIDTQSEQITEMQREIDELVSALNTKDMTIAELEGKVNELTSQIEELSRQIASMQAAYDNLQGKVSANNQYRNIAIIVALASVLLNIILVYMLLRAKTKYSRAALPPAKKDESVLDNSVKKEETNKKEAKNEAVENNTKNTSENENNTAKEQKRGRPKKSEIETETIEKTETVENNEPNTAAKKRGRPKKVQ